MKNEIEDTKWGRYHPELTKIEEKEMNEMLGILDNINSRKVDVINWEEKSRMNEASARHGHLIQSENSNVFSQPTNVDPKTPNKKANRVDELTVAVSKEEKELMDSLGGIMDAWEGLNG